jgi:hypothetical protein
VHDWAKADNAHVDGLWWLFSPTDPAGEFGFLGPSLFRLVNGKWMKIESRLFANVRDRAWSMIAA